MQSAPQKPKKPKPQKQAVKKAVTKKPKSPEPSTELYISGAVGVVGTLMALGGLTVPPWIGALMWASAIAVFCHGLWRLEWRKVFRVALIGVAILVGYNLWHATSPHAEIKITSIAMAAREDRRPGVIDVQVNYINNGRSKASLVGASRIAIYEVFKPEDYARRRQIEDGLADGFTDEFKKWPDAYSSIDPNDPQFASFNESLSFAGAEDVYAGKYSLFIISQLRYYDWWPFQRTTTKCVYYVGSALYSCLGNNWSR